MWNLDIGAAEKGMFLAGLMQGAEGQITRGQSILLICALHKMKVKSHAHVYFPYNHWLK